MLELRALEDDVVEVRLEAALAADRLGRLDNAMVARRVKALAEAAGAAAANVEFGGAAPGAAAGVAPGGNGGGAGAEDAEGAAPMDGVEAARGPGLALLA